MAFAFDAEAFSRSKADLNGASMASPLMPVNNF